MRVGRDQAYLIVGAALLIASGVLQIARDNATLINWSDFFLALAAVTIPQVLVTALLALLFPRRLGIAAAIVATIWIVGNRVELAPVFAAFGFAGAGFGFAVIVVMPVLVLVLLFVSNHLISRLVGTIGAAFFVLAAAELGIALKDVDVFGATNDVKHLIDGAPIAREAPNQTAGARLPDIIYVIPDRYPSQGVLQRVYNHDNSAFLDALRERGFAVATNARANYLHTRYSIASSMNMQYLDPALAALDGQTLREEPLYNLIRENLVIERLKRLGYHTIIATSSWDGMRESTQADEVVSFWPMFFAGEFGLVALMRNPFVMITLQHAMGVSQCEAFKRQLRFIENVGGAERPTFVLLHILVPHLPLSTDARGECIRPIGYPSFPDDVPWDDFTFAFSGFLSYFNDRILEIFDKHKENNPNPMIFVLQSDEGPFPRALHENWAQLAGKMGAERFADFEWQNANDDDLATKFGILNAFYFNGVDMTGVSNDISPINNWRLIFSHIEGVEHPMLPNRHFIFPSARLPYRMIEITKKLEAIPR